MKQVFKGTLTVWLLALGFVVLGMWLSGCCPNSARESSYTIYESN